MSAGVGVSDSARLSTAPSPPPSPRRSTGQAAPPPLVVNEVLQLLRRLVRTPKSNVRFRAKPKREETEERERESACSAEKERESASRLSGILGLHFASELAMRKARARQKRRRRRREEQRCRRRRRRYLPTYPPTAPTATARLLTQQGRERERERANNGGVDGERHEQGALDRLSSLTDRHSDQRTDRPTDRRTSESLGDVHESGWQAGSSAEACALPPW